MKTRLFFLFSPFSVCFIHSLSIAKNAKANHFLIWYIAVWKLSVTFNTQTDTHTQTRLIFTIAVNNLSNWSFFVDASRKYF